MGEKIRENITVWCFLTFNEFNLTRKIMKKNGCRKLTEKGFQRLFPEGHCKAILSIPLIRKLSSKRMLFH